MLKVDRTPSPLCETRSRSSAPDGQTEQARFGQAVPSFEDFLAIFGKYWLENRTILDETKFTVLDLRLPFSSETQHYLTLFTRNLTIKLLTCATGRAMDISDRPEIDRIATELQKKGGGLLDLMQLVVTSRTFLTK